MSLTIPGPNASKACIAKGSTIPTSRRGSKLTARQAAKSEKAPARGRPIFLKFEVSDVSNST